MGLHFFVPQNVEGLIVLEGGRQPFVSKLDRLFDGKYYDHGNEPSHHIAYLYQAPDAASKTQKHVRALLESEYKDSPAGLAGNDDAGQMSAWYILSALGFYQVSPGMPEYWLCSPRFDYVIVSLPNQKKVRIVAHGASAGRVYVQGALLNGAEVKGDTIQHKNMIQGGVLEFEMRDKPVNDH